MWGIVPAAGKGSRIQPLAFSKELLPVGSRFDGTLERPKAVSEFLMERMVRAGTDKICVIISAGKSDIVEYFGAGYQSVPICYAVQEKPRGLCDAIFTARPLIASNEEIIVGLPDTVWFPEDGLRHLPRDQLSFLLFPVDRPELFDAVTTDPYDSVTRIHVKQPGPPDAWIWGAFKMPGTIFHELGDLWLSRQCRDEYFGTLVNAYLDNGGRAAGIRAGLSYVDVGTVHGYREAVELLSSLSPPVPV